jgi:hypothetical protein
MTPKFTIFRCHLARYGRYNGLKSDFARFFDRRRASRRPRRASSPAPLGAGLGVGHSPGNFGGGRYLDQGVRISRAELATALQTPLSLLDTEIGAELVMDTLGRIEHGVFA